jgi:hypothetical protein
MSPAKYTADQREVCQFIERTTRDACDRVRVDYIPGAMRPDDYSLQLEGV